MTENLSITGVGKNTSHPRGYNTCSIKAVKTNYCQRIYCHVIHEITCNIPDSSLSKHSINIPANVVLVDPEFSISREVDMLLVAEVIWPVLLGGRLSRDNLHYIETRFGWVLGGVLENITSREKLEPTCHVTLAKESNIERILTKFWEDDAIGENKKQFSDEELRFKNHFLSTFSRDVDSGRFVVQLSFKLNDSQLGDSYRVTMARLENRFKKDNAFHQFYKQAMQEYLDADVMEIVPSQEIVDPKAYYLPHSGVIKESNTSTKLPVVFDGTARPSNGLSLNESLMTVPTIQDDLFSLLVRFRTYKYVMTADISKMYLQIKLHQTHQDY